MMIMCHMIQKTITYSCHSCGSINIVKNGTNKCGNQQYHCHDCGAYQVLEPKTTKPKREKVQVLQAYRKRVSLRGIERIFGINRQTTMKWIITETDQLPDMPETLLPARPDDVLELDEAWSFFGQASPETMVVDSIVPTNSSNRGLRYW